MVQWLLLADEELVFLDLFPAPLVRFSFFSTTVGETISFRIFPSLLSVFRLVFALGLLLFTSSLGLFPFIRTYFFNRSENN